MESLCPISRPGLVVRHRTYQLKEKPDIHEQEPCKTMANLYSSDFGSFTKGPIAIYSSKCTPDKREYLDFLRTDGYWV